MTAANLLAGSSSYVLQGSIGDGPYAASGFGWDYDFYNLGELTVGQVVNASLFTEFDTVLGLYDASGNLVVFNDDANGSGGSLNDLDSSISFTVTATGSYYLGISDYDGNLPVDPFDPVAGRDPADYAYSGGTYSATVSLDGGQTPNWALPALALDTQYLDGEVSLDTLTGGMDNDVYVVDGQYTKVASSELNDCGDSVPVERLEWTTDTVLESADEGYDVVVSSASFTLTDNVEELRLVFDTATQSTHAQYGADLVAYGQDGVGNELDNVIVGNELNNRLDGGAGADTLIGGLGNDTYAVDQLGDLVVEQADAGTDTVQSYVSYQLGDNLENLTLLGNADSGLGNSADNILVGSDVGARLEGFAGNDKLVGGAGDDWLAGGEGDDRYVIRLGGAADVIDDGQGSDTLFFGNDLTAADLHARRVNDDLMLSIGNTQDSVTLNQWFAQTSGGVSRIEFCDSAALDRLAIETLANVAPVAQDDAVSTDEDAGVVVVPTVDLLGNDTDADSVYGDVLSLLEVSQAESGAAVTQVGQEVLYEMGTAFQHLQEGQIATDTFAYTVSDAYGATSTAKVTLTITGVNDGPSVLNDEAAVVEDGIVAATGNVLGNDSDVDIGDTLTVVNTGATAGNYGMLDLGADGQYTYTLNNASQSVQSLAQGQVVVDQFSYEVSDGIATATSELNISITGTNDCPGAISDTAQVQEDVSLTAIGNVLTNDSDVDTGDTLTVVNPGTVVGNYGVLDLGADGQYNYTLNNTSQSVQSLAQGQVVSDQFSYEVTDGLASSSSELTVSITGTNDGPVASADTAQVQEDMSLTATGNVLANDSDVDAGTVLTLVNAGTFTGNYGSVVLSADGSYTYTLNNNAVAVQSLTQGASVADVFAYSVTDGVESVSSALTVNVSGLNDAPVVSVPMSDQSVKAGTALNYQLPISTFTDVDTGDVLSYQARLSNGLALPAWLKFDQATRTFTGTPAAANLGALSVDVIATDTMGATALDTFLLNVTSAATGGGTGCGSSKEDKDDREDKSSKDDSDHSDKDDKDDKDDRSSDCKKVTQSNDQSHSKDAGSTKECKSDGSGDGEGDQRSDEKSKNRVSLSDDSDKSDHGSGNGKSNTLDGGKGDDHYRIVRGCGADTVVDKDSSKGNTDVAEFGGGIAANQLWFRHVSSDLEISIVGSNDKLVIQDWYLGSQYHVEQFKTSDGKTLLDSQVQNLVSAMAGFAPPAAGQTTLTAAYQTTLAPVLAANWQ
ncbi:hypothetical protein MIZ03_2419 [Rhodoferax lithotrophicus]|uniref:Dystroglycan-type cadherin-like domain-containing protein n=1 Tax=Rhodoferax lithotrophicus TaxID=2798804 RepID=A0ABM7MMN1_9BURK|nr:VCBS domain-containing protein [Rhodoferax sp. MIZ03]BCO27531.1 hypothetical protein MIZ03_2419 [Rhodoferax sp. MIZ03]